MMKRKPILKGEMNDEYFSNWRKWTDWETGYLTA